MNRLPRDLRLLSIARVARMFAYGAGAVVLAVHLSKLGLSDARTGQFLTATLVGDAVLTFVLGRASDRLGRRRVLLVSSVLLLAAGIAFVVSANPWVLLAAAVIGIMSPSGGEAGPFLPVEQTAAAELLPPGKRVPFYAAYNFMGSVATATGALVGGVLAMRGTERAFAIYVVAGIISLACFGALSASVERASPAPSEEQKSGRAKGPIWGMSALFALDSFGSGLALQSVVSLWLYRRFLLNPDTLGSVFMVTNMLAAFSALLSGSIAARIGPLRTMVFTHLPANLLLLAFPFAPNLTVALCLLFARFLLAQMDVPARMAFTMAVVPKEARAEAATMTGIAKSAGNALGPQVAGALLQNHLVRAPFVLAACLKIVYDTSLYIAFRKSESAGDECSETTRDEAQ